MKRLQDDPALIHCSRCGAYYRPSNNWLRGRWAAGTSDEFIAMGSVRQNECVICLKAPRLEPYPPAPLPM